MLRINLLPVRQLKKRAKAKKQLGGMLILFFAALAVCAVVAMFQMQTLSSLQDEKAALQKEKQKYTPILAEIEKLKKTLEELKTKTAVINKLKSDSSLTVRVLDEVARNIDPQRMWLTSLEQQNTSLTLTGIALDNQTIAQFMDKLVASDFVNTVDLNDSSLKVISGRNLKSFKLNCSVSQPKKEQSDQIDQEDVK